MDSLGGASSSEGTAVAAGPLQSKGSCLDGANLLVSCVPCLRNFRCLG